MRPEDIRDALLRRLAPWGRAPERAPAPPPPAVPAPTPPGPRARTTGGRPFLSDLDVRRSLTPGARTLTIEKDAIVSPLALEWLALKGVRIVRSS